MSVSKSTEKKMLTANEFELVSKTHHPDITELAGDELGELARRLRDYRNKARDVARQQRREMRGKADPRGARPARDNTGTKMKGQIFTDALQRVNREMGRLEQAARRENQGEITRRALALKRANQVRHHPAAGPAGSSGMQPVANQGPTVEADPREIGRVSQFVKSDQARRDSGA